MDNSSRCARKGCGQVERHPIHRVHINYSSTYSGNGHKFEPEPISGAASTGEPPRCRKCGCREGDACGHKQSCKFGEFCDFAEAARPSEPSTPKVEPLCATCGKTRGAGEHSDDYLKMHTFTARPEPVAGTASAPQDWIGARCWKYPEDVPLTVPDSVSFPAQNLIIAANPEDHELPWAVILEDRREMYDIAELSFEGRAIGKTDWSADNYWYPRMWIEIVGVLNIEGRRATIAAAPSVAGTPAVARCPNPNCESDKLWVFWYEQRVGCDSCRANYYVLNMADFAQFFSAQPLSCPKCNHGPWCKCGKQVFKDIALQPGEQWRHFDGGSIACSQEIIRGPLRTPPAPECGARKAGTAGGNYPQDCDWSFCGCDPLATKVMETLLECGWIGTAEANTLKTCLFQMQEAAKDLAQQLEHRKQVRAMTAEQWYANRHVTCRCGHTGIHHDPEDGNCEVGPPCEKKCQRFEARDLQSETK